MTRPHRVWTVAERLGVSRVTVLRLIWQRRFPNAFKVGSDWRIPAADLEEFISRESLEALEAKRD